MAGVTVRKRSPRFGKKLDHEIAQEIYGKADHIADKVIDTTKPPTDGVGVGVERGTAIQVLRRRAARQGMHAYVLSGPQPGKSVGLFKALPAEPDAHLPVG